MPYASREDERQVENKNDTMSPTDKLAVIGHNGWAARSIIRALAAQPFQQPIRVLARESSNTDSLPTNTEIARYSWNDEASISESLKGIDVLLYFTPRLSAWSP